MEDPTIDAPAEPKSGVVPGLDLAGYTTTPAAVTPVAPGFRITREAVIVEWTDRNVANATFEGTARELFRMQLASPIHPLGEMTFNPAARRGDPEWRVMYVGVGDSGSGEQRDIRRLNPQRLDNFNGKILRIVPDLRAHTATSTVSENGRYRIPNDNPFVAVDGARKEIWAAGLRNPHRLSWDVDPAGRTAPRLIAFNIGLTQWETVLIVEKGANYGYPLREGTQAMTPQGMTPVPADDTIPVQITDTIARGTVKPTYPVIAYPHTASGGDAVAGGFVYRGRRIPALKGRLVFGDITTGRIWYAEMADVRNAHDGNPTTVATMHELDAGVRGLVEQTYRARGGKGRRPPRRRCRLRPRPRGSPLRGRRSRRAVCADEDRRHDPPGGRREVVHAATRGGDGRLATFACLSLVWSTPAAAQDPSVGDAADRPGFADSAVLAGRGHILFETGFTLAHDGDDRASVRTLTWPQVELHGGLTSWLDLSVIWDGLVSARTRTSSSGIVDEDTTTGLDDFRVGVKVRLVRRPRLNAALIGYVNVPVGSDVVSRRYADPLTRLAWSLAHLRSHLRGRNRRPAGGERGGR